MIAVNLLTNASIAGFPEIKFYSLAEKGNLNNCIEIPLFVFIIRSTDVLSQTLNYKGHWK